jgi:regulator of replication initiation timing
VRAQNIRPKDTERLQRERDELAEALKKARRERNELREEVKRLVRIVHVLEVENDSLKSTSSARQGTVRVLPQRSAPPPTQC